MEPFLFLKTCLLGLVWFCLPSITPLFWEQHSHFLGGERPSPTWVPGVWERRTPLSVPRAPDGARSHLLAYSVAPTTRTGSGPEAQSGHSVGVPEAYREADRRGASSLWPVQMRQRRGADGARED